MECTNARGLIPSYLDGELSEAQAGPLRKHLLGCQTCRGEAQGEKNLKRWFAAEPPVAVPRDFAARVARRAFAGDTGEAPARTAVAAVAAVAPSGGEGRLLTFVLRATAVAAALLFALSIAIGNLDLPSGARLMADTAPERNLERALEELERLNAAEAQPSEPAPAGAARRGGERP